MKKFIVKLFIYLFILSGCVIVINFAYIKMDKTEDNEIGKFRNIPTDIQICNFGSSHGFFGYNYTDIDDKYTCFNFGLVSQVLSYDSRLLENYKDNISENAVVFITVSWFSFFGDERNAADFEIKNRRYYRILPADLIKDYDVLTDIEVKFRSLYAPRVKLAIVLLGRSQADHIDVVTTNKEEAADDADKTFLRHFVTDMIDEEGNPIYNDEEIAALYDMIAICKEIGATPVLITTPFLQEYTVRAQEGAEKSLREFYRIINQVVEDTGVKYFDYSTDERFKNNYSFFMNCDHLNMEGARVFTDILMEEVVGQYIMDIEM